MNPVRPAKPFERTTSPGRFVMGMVTAMFLGAALVAIPFGPFFIVAFPVALIFWGPGVVVAAAIWWALTRRGYRGRAAAMLLGAGLSGGGSALLLLLYFNGEFAALPVSLIVAAVGALAALAGWQVAYSREGTLSQDLIDETFE